MATGNTSYSAAISRTLQHHDTEIVDAVSGQNALLWLLKQRGNLKVRTGGRTFTHPVLYGTNTSFREYTELEEIDTPNPDLITRAEYNVRIIAGSLVIPWLEEAQNAGDREKLLDLAESVKLQAVVSMGEHISTSLWRASPSSTQWESLPKLINDSPSTQTDVGGIDASSTGNTYWRGQTYTTAVTAFNTSSAGLTAMSTLLNNCVFGPYGPKVIIATKAIWSLYDVGQGGNMRYTHPALADAGFQNLDYAGLPVLADSNCTASHLFMINTEAIYLQVLRRGNMITTSFRPAPKQLADIGLMYLFGNITAGDRRTSGVATSITG